MLTILYDSYCLEYIAYEPGGIVPNPNINFVINKSENGTLKLLFLGYSLENELINSDGTLANITFKVSSSEAESTSLRINNANFGDDNFNYLYPTLVEGIVYISRVSQATPIPQNSLKVIVGSANANTGDIITVPVAFESAKSAKLLKLKSESVCIIKVCSFSKLHNGFILRSNP